MEGKNMQQDLAATTDWRRLACDEARECGNQQPIHVIRYGRLACDEARECANQQPIHVIISSSLQAGGLGDRAPTPLLCGVEHQSEPAGPVERIAMG